MDGNVKGWRDWSYVGDGGRDWHVVRWSDWLHTDALNNELSVRPPFFPFIAGNQLWQNKNNSVNMLTCVWHCWAHPICAILRWSDSFSFRHVHHRCQLVCGSGPTIFHYFTFVICFLCRFKLTQIVVDTSAGPFKNYTVVFLGSDNGHVLKILASTEGANASFSTQLLEDIDVYNPNKSDHLPSLFICWYLL